MQFQIAAYTFTRVITKPNCFRWAINGVDAPNYVTRGTIAKALRAARELNLQPICVEA